MGYLDNNGLLYLWNKIKSTFVAQVEGKGLSTNDYTTTEKNKLSGIATGATKNTVENVLTSTSTTNALSAAQGKALKALIDAVPTGDMSKSVYDTDGDGVVDKAKTADTAGDAATVNGKTVGVNVPSNAKFTDTTYGVFSDSANGLVPKPAALSPKRVLASSKVWVSPKVEYKSGDRELCLQHVVEGDGGNVVDVTSVTLPLVSSSAPGLMGSSYYSKLQALPTNETLESTYATKSDVESTYAKKSELTNLYKYKGSVTDASKLPTSGQTTGDVYNIEAASTYGGAGMNVAWNGSAWDALGEMFTINGITNAEIDTICV